MLKNADPHSFKAIYVSVAGLICVSVWSPWPPSLKPDIICLFLNYVLEELVIHADDTDRSFIKDLLPWSDKVRNKCPILKKS